MELVAGRVKVGVVCGLADVGVDQEDGGLVGVD